MFVGDFESQQLAFAHLLDVADRTGRSIALDQVDVIQREPREVRLGHYFKPDTVGEVCARMASENTVVLVTDADALPHADTAHLRWIGVFEGSLVRARTDTSC